MVHRALGFVCVAGAFLTGILWHSERPVREEPKPAAVNTLSELQDVARRLRPLQEPLGEPQPGDWLAEHKEEGQTFAQFLKRHPAPTPKGLATIYIQPLGEFGPTQQKLVATTARCLELFYGRPVKTLPGISLQSIPEEARRINDNTHEPQILSTYVLEKVLRPKRPKDALAVLALSAADLWPGKGWNFVFGQASLSERVGVWSISRFGDPDESPEAYQRCLTRMLGTAVHETGHMLGIPHCIAAQCGMNGSNSLPESDRGHLYFCAECQPKVWWSCELNPPKNLAALVEFAKTNNLQAEAEYWSKALEATKQAKPAK